MTDKRRAAVVLIFFGLVYASSLSFTYVEGDDASTVAYHALGRHEGLQKAYSPYHGMVDVVLRRLPADERTLRLAIFGLTALSAVAFFLLMTRLVGQWLPGARRSPAALVALVVLLAVPEIFYLGLIYSPSLIAMCAVLAAHLLLRRATKNGWSSAIKRHPIAVIGSLALFGVGVSFRWDIAAYAVIIGTDLATRDSVDGRVALSWSSLSFSVGWMSLAALAGVIAIAATGYGPRQFISVIQLAGDELTQPHSLFSTIGSFQTLFTPACLLLAGFGFVTLLRRDRRLATIVVFGTLPVLPYMLTREPKMLLPAWPLLVLCVVSGLERIRSFPASRRVGWAGGLLLVLPWIIGVSVDSPDTAWGPGFDVRTAAPTRANDERPALISGVVSRHPMSLRGFSFTLAGGLAVPTPEGPRPLGGHAAVLLAGRWRTLQLKLAHERTAVVDRAIAEGIPIVQDNRNAYLVDELVRRGYSTNDPRDAPPGPAFTQRTFTAAGEPSVRIIYHVTKPSILRQDQFQLLRGAAQSNRIIFSTNFTSALREWFDAQPDALEPLGPFSVIIDLERIRAARNW